MAKIAFVGDVHGKITQMYAEVNMLPVNVSTIIQLGDFHAIRDEEDLARFPCPLRHRKMGDFPDFIKQGRVPIPTYFIGGNHSNFNWFNEFSDGAELLPNLHYLGRSGTRTIEGLSVGWISGNYSETSYDSIKKGRYGHIRKADLVVLENKERLDLLLLHDWPQLEELLEYVDIKSVSDQKFFDQAKNRGSPQVSKIIKSIRPRHIYCGHMHRSLELTLNINGQLTQFHALSELGDSNSISVMDISDLQKSSQSLFDVAAYQDRAALIDAFGRLERDQLGLATQYFTRLAKHKHDGTRGLALYGLGVAHLKKPEDPKNIDRAIIALSESIGLAEHADAHLMLAQGLQHKLSAVFCTQPASAAKDEDMIAIIDRAIEAFNRAQELNPNYTTQSQSSVVQLKRKRSGFANRLKSY